MNSKEFAKWIEETKKVIDRDVSFYLKSLQKRSHLMRNQTNFA